MQHIARENFTFVMDASKPPTLRIKSGEEFTADTFDAFMGVWDKGTSPEHVGGSAGPVFVEGAMPGDALKVELLEITPVELKPGCGVLHNVLPGRGFLGADFTEHYPLVMPIKDGHIEFPGGIRIKTNPSLGYIGTTYTSPIPTNTDSGPYGGDIDMKELVAGSTIWLPVFVPGALLCFGDIHAVLGDGCVGGTGAECAGRVKLRVTLEKGMKLRRPRALTPDYFVTICYGEDLGAAMRDAVRDMVQYLVDEKGMKPYDAYSLLSLAGDVRISRAFRPVSPVKMMLARSVLDQIGEHRKGIK